MVMTDSDSSCKSMMRGFSICLKMVLMSGDSSKMQIIVTDKNRNTAIDRFTHLPDSEKDFSFLYKIKEYRKPAAMQKTINQVGASVSNWKFK